MGLAVGTKGALIPVADVTDLPGGIVGLTYF